MKVLHSNSVFTQLQHHSTILFHCWPTHLNESATQHYCLCTITASFNHTFPLLTYTSEWKCYTALLSVHNYSIIQPHISIADLPIWMKVLHSTIVCAQSQHHSTTLFHCWPTHLNESATQHYCLCTITASFNHTFALFTHKHYGLLPSGWWFCVPKLNTVNICNQQHFWTNKSIQMSEQCVRACMCVCANYINY